MEKIKNYSRIVFILSIYIFLLFIVSCEKNSVSTENDPEIVFDYLNFDIDITDKTDTTCTINVNSEIIYHPENSGFQIMADGYMFHDSDRTSGFGRGAPFIRYEFDNPRLSIQSSRFIDIGEIDTIFYEGHYTDVELNFYTIFEFQLFGIFTDEPLDIDVDTLSSKSFYYCLVDTLIY